MYTLERMVSSLSRVLPVRIANEAYAQLEADYKRQGFESLGAYARAMIEQHTFDYGILLELSEPTVKALEKRSKAKGYPALRDYITALLEAYALAEIPMAEPKKKRR